MRWGFWLTLTMVMDCKVGLDGKGCKRREGQAKEWLEGKIAVRPKTSLPPNALLPSAALPLRLPPSSPSTDSLDLTFRKRCLSSVY